MAVPADPSDPKSARYLLNLTDYIKSKSNGSDQLFQSIGFRVHRVKVGVKPVVVKVYEGLPPGSVPNALKNSIHDELLEDMRAWKRLCSGEYFAKLIGYCDSEDSILPAPVFEARPYAQEHLKKARNIDFFDFCLGLALGLAYLHTIPIAHGDIREDNILIGNNGQPLLADYGLSRILRMVDRDHAELKADISPTRWMPFEWINLDSDDVREPTMYGDVWTFGMTMLELWSQHPPYYGVKPEKVSVMIYRHKLPNFPPRANVWADVPEEKVKFVCRLCWHKEPLHRKTMSELVSVLNDLKNKSDFDLIRKKYEAEDQFEYPRSPPSSHPPLYGSLTSDPVTSSSLENSIYFDPAGGQDASPSRQSRNLSSVNSITSDRTVRASGKSDFSGSGSSYQISEWSALHRLGLGGVGHGNASQSSMQGQDHDESSVTSSPGIPPPPSPDNLWVSVTSKKTAFLNYISGNRKQSKVEFKTYNKGEPHSPEWTAICKLDGRQYAKVVSRGKKKDAEEEVARVALEKICREDPGAMISISPPYISTFKTYLMEHDLSDRVEWIYDSDGEPHMKTWTCDIRRDGVLLGRGTASKKANAAEEAAKEAARMWNLLP